jgi:hypothetical protein
MIPQTCTETEIEEFFLELVSKWLSPGSGQPSTGKIPETEILVQSILAYAEIDTKPAIIREGFEYRVRQAVETLRSVSDAPPN